MARICLREGCDRGRTGIHRGLYAVRMNESKKMVVDGPGQCEKRELVVPHLYFLLALFFP